MSEVQPEVQRVGVVGAGVMGGGIAQSLAVAGYTVVCMDREQRALDAAQRDAESGRFGIAGAVERGKLDAAAADAARARIQYTRELAAAAAGELIIECVPEKLEIKLQLFRELDALAPRETILASNTSGLPITALAYATARAERVIGWHWASPAFVMRLAEIVVCPATADETRAVIERAAERCGKNPIVVRDNPMQWGFVANRVYFAMVREAQRVVAEGVADREQVNQLMVDCFRWPVGPFAMVKGAGSGWKK